MKKEESGWLLERQNGSAVEWLMIVGNTGRTTEAAQFEWTPMATCALRFSRREDAVLFVSAMRTLSVSILHGSTIVGLRKGDPVPAITEHIWTEDLPPPSPPKPNAEKYVA